jgi:hypothetical protein
MADDERSYRVLTPAFSKKAFCAFVPAVSPFQLRDWKNAKLLEPSIINYNRRGDSSFWSVRDVVLVEFALLLSGARYGTIGASIRAIDPMLPRRREEVTPGSVFHWSGGELHMGDLRSGVPVLIDEQVWPGNMFVVREDVELRFAEAEAGAELIDVAALISTSEAVRRLGRQ